MAYTDIDDPTAYFQTKPYAGDGTTNNAQTFDGNTDMQPDMVWFKRRSGGANHFLYDSVRGANRSLVPNDTDAEATSGEQTTYLTSFDSNGFTLGDDVDNVNASGSTYVLWGWLAGTSVSGSTTGSGTPQSYTASVSTTAGFSITAFTGNGTANHTIPHNLGVAPDWFIIKKRIGTGDSTPRDWNVYHSSLGNTKRIALNSTGAVSTSSEYWNDTSPTSSVVNLGTNDQINGNNNTYIMYAFAEKKGFSKFGSYVGNGSTDGTFVYTGFKPAWVMCKRTDSTGVWFICDIKRVGFNGRPNNTATVGNPELSANDSRSEAAGNTNIMDIYSNGFKLISSGVEINGSGASFIYMAFANNPFVTSTGIPGLAR